MNPAALSFEHFRNPFTDYQPQDEIQGALRILRWAYDMYGDSLVYACSFGAEGIVMIDLISKVKPDAKVVFLDTGVHFQETYDLIDKVKRKYPQLKIELRKPELTLDQQAAEHGEALWERRPDQCCYIRKIKPLEEALSGVPAWLSGLRREQSESRSHTNFVNKDERFQSVKICPLIYWTWDFLWQYIRLNNLDYNVLHDKGYPSIGCRPCTFQAQGDGRSGRWQGFEKSECGLHTPKSESS
ncbi:phosphoadenylyl-sulfate reductase [Halobacillus yeomjeoni]|uniref:Adenosine 5'-phosphosulfate reductase n=1 Tax=Halobacillus yeomjeoni TaxID=311194 RepID=A0A931HUI3_9BACI|nr:phosphoadenylyl-sulfate reductase [Halobacillus yeomjeoni]MBH0229466.1 phosphoadenylyl-sulfate reductase [Halobacillus yeomjeoni]